LGLDGNGKQKKNKSEEYDHEFFAINEGSFATAKVQALLTVSRLDRVAVRRPAATMPEK
jgi:hypothetical protein